MPVYICPKCGREVEMPPGRYYCKVCGSSAIMIPLRTRGKLRVGQVYNIFWLLPPEKRNADTYFEFHEFLRGLPWEDVELIRARGIAEHIRPTTAKETKVLNEVTSRLAEKEPWATMYHAFRPLTERGVKLIESKLSEMGITNYGDYETLY